MSSDTTSAKQRFLAVRAARLPSLPTDPAPTASSVVPQASLTAKSPDTTSPAQRFLVVRAARLLSLHTASAPIASSVVPQASSRRGGPASVFLAWRSSRGRTDSAEDRPVAPQLVPPPRPPILSTRPSFEMSPAISTASPGQPSREPSASSNFLSWRANARFASGSSSSRHFRGQSSPDTRPLWLRESISFQDYPRPVRDYISEKRPGAASQQSRLDDAVAAHEVLLWLYARDPVAFDALVWDRQLSQSEAWDQAVIFLTFRKKANVMNAKNALQRLITFSDARESSSGVPCYPFPSAPVIQMLVSKINYDAKAAAGNRRTGSTYGSKGTGGKAWINHLKMAEGSLRARIDPRVLEDQRVSLIAELPTFEKASQPAAMSIAMQCLLEELAAGPTLFRQVYGRSPVRSLSGVALNFVRAMASMAIAGIRTVDGLRANVSDSGASRDGFWFDLFVDLTKTGGRFM